MTYFPYASDLATLNQLYNRSLFSFVFLYGRDGTGKTRLVREFCKDKKTLFLSGREIVPEFQMKSVQKEMERQCNFHFDSSERSDWKQLLNTVAENSMARRLVLVFDEFQFFAEHDPAFLNAFKKCLEHSFPAARIFLIITSSSVSYSEELLQNNPAISELLSARSFMGSLPFSVAAPYLNNFSYNDQYLLYGITGGLSNALESLDVSVSVEENLYQLYFRSDAPLLFAPLNYLHRELRETSTYNQILEIIAFGTNRLADISSLADIGTNKCAKYLNILISLGILKKEIPCIGDNSKKVRYLFADHMMRFWYRFVYPNIGTILGGGGRELLEIEVVPELPDFRMDVQEDICRDYLERLFISGQAPFLYTGTGSWWKGGTKREPYSRIPLLFFNHNHALLGACVCGEQPATPDTLRELMQPVPELDGMNKYYCIFSMNGFSEELKGISAKVGNVWLIEPEDM